MPDQAELTKGLDLVQRRRLQQQHQVHVLACPCLPRAAYPAAVKLLILK
jgi:hypothetical protein